MRPLPGLPAQLLMVPKARLQQKLQITASTKESSVVILLFEKKHNPGNIYFPLIERGNNQGVHSGQIALPGGKVETTDSDFIAAGLREVQEEIGVTVFREEVIGKLSDLYIPVSNFLVHPLIAIKQDTTCWNSYEYTLDPKEVTSVLELSIGDLLDDRIVKYSNSHQASYFEVQGKVLWGATAMILSELKSLLANL
ncbi:MAG: CoA pyrophosphatase [Oligoflexia bacterium]|nr:CoA pyrophosphatase [Oligoflexia bacterium]MBF0366213.1 CoA pyrophosphatase [Oligoflexia bacterium]